MERRGKERANVKESSKQEKSQIMRIISLIPPFRRCFSYPTRTLSIAPSTSNPKKNARIKRGEVDRGGGFHQMALK